MCTTSNNSLPSEDTIFKPQDFSRPQLDQLWQLTQKHDLTTISQVIEDAYFQRMEEDKNHEN